MAGNTLRLTTADLTLDTLAWFLSAPSKIVLDQAVQTAVARGRQVVDAILQEERPVYGVNTGFGKFAEVRIPLSQVAELQHRLILSHAAGVGPPIPQDIVRLMMLLKLHTLGQGYSGVRMQVVQLLMEMLHRQVIPVIPAKGSVGASGDLAPLAHLALVMIGAGHSWVRGENGGESVPGHIALQQAGLAPIRLAAKEGLAIVNGTQAMTAYAAWTLLQARRVVETADIIGAISLEALLGTLTACDARLHTLRHHPGQRQVAANVRRLLADSPIVASIAIRTIKCKTPTVCAVSPRCMGRCGTLSHTWLR
jgi:histidine ammonia-lyase